jgi:hypothetical protein
MKNCATTSYQCKLPEEKLNNKNFKAANKIYEILLLLLRFNQHISHCIYSLITGGGLAFHLLLL